MMVISAYKIYIHALMNEDADYDEAIPAFLPYERVNSGGAEKTV